MKLRFTLRGLARIAEIRLKQPESTTREHTKKVQQDLINNPLFQAGIKEIRESMKKHDKSLKEQIDKLLKDFDLSPIGGGGFAQLLLKGHLNNFPLPKDVGRIRQNWEKLQDQESLTGKRSPFEEVEIGAYPITIDVAAHASFPQLIKFLKINREIIEVGLKAVVPAAKPSRSSRIHIARDALIVQLKEKGKTYLSIARVIKKHKDPSIKNANFDEDAARAAYNRAKGRGLTGR